MLSSNLLVAAATSATARSKASALCRAGARMPAIFRTYCNAAACTSSGPTTSVYGGRNVLMLRHMATSYRRGYDLGDGDNVFVPICPAAMTLSESMNTSISVIDESRQRRVRSPKRLGEGSAVRITVQCEPTDDPVLDRAAADVLVRPCTLGTDDLQQLRRVLHQLVTTARRNITVDLCQCDDVRRTNVVAVLVGAAREARTTGSTLRTYGAPAGGRHALFVAGIEEVGSMDEASYEVIVGKTTVTEQEYVAV